MLLVAFVCEETDRVKNRKWCVCDKYGVALVHALLSTRRMNKIGREYDYYTKPGSAKPAVRRPPIRDASLALEGFTTIRRHKPEVNAHAKGPGCVIALLTTPRAPGANDSKGIRGLDRRHCQNFESNDRESQRLWSMSANLRVLLAAVTSDQ